MADTTDSTKQEELKLKRLELWIGVGKFLLGTVALGLVATAVNAQIQNRQIAIEELRQLGEFTDLALDPELGTRLRFAQYFATVTTSDRVRRRWERWSDVLAEERAQRIDSITMALEDRAELSEDSVAALTERLETLSTERRSRTGPISFFVGRFDPARSPVCTTTADPLSAMRQRIDEEMRAARIGVNCAVGVFTVPYRGNLIDADPLFEYEGDLGLITAHPMRPLS